MKQILTWLVRGYQRFISRYFRRVVGIIRLVRRI